MTRDKPLIMGLLTGVATEPGKPRPKPTADEIREDLARSYRDSVREMADRIGPIGVAAAAIADCQSWSPLGAPMRGGHITQEQAREMWSPSDIRQAQAASADATRGAADLARMHASMLDRAVTLLVEHGIPMEKLWMEHEVDRQETRVMMGPSGRDSDPDLRSCVARVWVEFSVSADLATPGSQAFFCVRYEGPDLPDKHGMVTGDGPVGWLVPVPETPEVDYRVSAVGDESFKLSSERISDVDPSPRTAATRGYKVRSLRCLKCNAIVSQGTSRCHKCGSKRIG